MSSYGEVTTNYSYGLVNSALFVSHYLNSIGIEAKVVTVDDHNGIDKVVFEEKPTHVIIEALWVTSSKLNELINMPRYRDIIWIVRIHSKIPFISNEGIAFAWLKEYADLSIMHENLIIAPNSEEFTSDLQDIFVGKFIYLPNIYQPNFLNKPIECQPKNHIDIGCFGAIRPMKNQLIQAIAAIKFGDEVNKKIRFHINATRTEQEGENVLKNLIALFDGINGRHELVMHEWLNHEEFIELIRTMDYGMQVSMSESFNIVTADFVNNRIPMVVSKDVDWMPFITKVNTTSSEGIKNRLKLYHMFDAFGIPMLSKLFLFIHNQVSKAVWVYQLKHI